MTLFVEGVYAGHFIVSEAMIGASGVSRSRDQITLPLGTAAMIAGEVMQSDGAGGFVPYTNVGTAIAVLYDNEDATLVEIQAVGMVRDCEVNGAELKWDDALSPAEIATGITQLQAAGIIVRASL